MAEQNSICLQNKMEPCRNKLKDSQEVNTMERGFIAADPEPLESFLPGNGEEVSNHLLRGIESAYLLGLHDDVPRPAEEAP